MAENEQPPAENGKDFGSLVSEAAVHARKQSASLATPSATPKKKSRRPLLGALSLLFLGVVGWNVYFFMYAGTPSSTFEETALQASLFLAQQAVEEEWTETGRLPASLLEVGADEDELSYSVTGEVYTITATGDRHMLIFQRGNDLTPLESAFQALLAGEVTR